MSGYACPKPFCNEHKAWVDASQRGFLLPTVSTSLCLEGRNVGFSLLCSALILEEIAIDCHNKETEQRLLQEAHDLHLSSLQLAKKAFGEFNVQTAKHYGNLGRLYQSMRKFKVRLYWCKGLDLQSARHLSVCHNKW